MMKLLIKTKVNNLTKKVRDATTLMRINQYNTDNQNLEENVGDIDKKTNQLTLDTSELKKDKGTDKDT